jgi:arsenate reductase
MSQDFPITIYHNPDCGTSRNALALVLAAGYEATVVEYLKIGWSRTLLDDLLAKTGLQPHDLIREKGSPAVELGLLAEGISDDTILSAMIKHPIIVNRPIVVTPKGAALCRPSERVLDLLDHRPAAFIKEDGEVVIG